MIPQPQKNCFLRALTANREKFHGAVLLLQLALNLGDELFSPAINVILSIKEGAGLITRLLLGVLEAGGVTHPQGKFLSPTFKDFVLDQLCDLNGVTCRAMFGGYGLYQGKVFFGIIHKGRLYFKTDRASLPAYRKRDMKPFRPNAKQTLKTYYEVPVEIIEDQEQLMGWAKQATGHASR